MSTKLRPPFENMTCVIDTGDGYEHYINGELVSLDEYMSHCSEKDSFTLDMDQVDHPNHYNKGSIEVIEVIEDWDLNFARGSVIKYVGRAGLKDDELQDLEKALWYIQREISRLKGE